MVDFATVYLKGTTYGSVTNEKGFFHLKAPAGDYTLVVSSVGYETTERAVQLVSGKVTEFNITITPVVVNLEEVVVASNGITNVKNSPFNTIAISTENLKNSTKNLSDALAKAPGVKLRESGGAGSDTQLMLDGFSGKHVKVFIDGVPQEGFAISFSLHIIPVCFAYRREGYKGVRTGGFGPAVRV